MRLREEKKWIDVAAVFRSFVILHKTLKRLLSSFALQGPIP